MNGARLLRSELRKITSTRLLWGHLAVASILGLLVFLVVVLTTRSQEMADFAPDTLPLQRDLISFGSNALLLGGLFGAVAAAREHRHGTIVVTYLATPRRVTAVVARLVVGLAAGAMIGLAGGGLSALAGSIALPASGYELLLGPADIAQAVGSAALAGAVAAGFGIGVGDVARNTGGAVTAAVFGLSILPPLVGALWSAVRDWMPNVLITRIAGSVTEPGMAAAIAAFVAWAVVPAIAGVVTSLQRDVT